jgi:CheY-like chemotaxis protein
MENTSTSPNSTAARGERRALRILYADDLPELRDVARLSFSREGHGVECCEDGSQALAQIEANSDFDLVITDHNMPNMDGLEFVTKLRERAFRGKVLVVSSGFSDSIARQYEEKKVDRIVYKPVFPAALRAILGELFPCASPAT